MNEFLAKYSNLTHWLAAAFGSLILAYNAVPAFHALVQQAYQAIPASVQSVALAALGLYMWYRNGQQPAPPAAPPPAAK